MELKALGAKRNSIAPVTSGANDNPVFVHDEEASTGMEQLTEFLKEMQPHQDGSSFFWRGGQRTQRRRCLVEYRENVCVRPSI